MHEPSYLQALRQGTLADRAATATARLAHCELCPRRCGVNRLIGQLGYCRAGVQARVASHHVHMWEEPPISGWGGSGTIFFSHCTARCLFCQNYPISQIGTGNLVTAEQLAGMMLTLQAQGCHNINLVTPTHYVPQILAALQVAAERGLHIPLIYNTSGYDAVETLALLEGIVDIYLPDAKYADNQVALQLSGYADYVEHNRRALIEIVRQVGLEVLLDEEDLVYRGMVVRHLVLPGGLSQTPHVLAWIAEHLGHETTISLMAQYFPAHQAVGHQVLGRHITPEEYQVALDVLDALGFDNGWCQELESEC